MRTEKKLPNISDVARAAGVSTATVSHTLNGTRTVSEHSRAVSYTQLLNTRKARGLAIAANRIGIFPEQSSVQELSLIHISGPAFFADFLFGKFPDEKAAMSSAQSFFGEKRSRYLSLIHI